MIRDLAALSLLALIGLSCVGVGSELTADADSVGETGLATESGIMTETGIETGSDSTTETSTDSDSEASSTETSSSTDTTETETSTDTDTTETSTDSTESSTETGMDGPTPDLGVLAIVDVNPTSTTFNQKVHPLDYAGQLSGWYFGHAT